jgi:hypothetical protein
VSSFDLVSMSKEVGSNAGAPVPVLGLGIASVVSKGSDRASGGNWKLQSGFGLLLLSRRALLSLILVQRVVKLESDTSEKMSRQGIN